MNRLKLSLALTSNEFSRPLIDGSVRAQGVDFVPTLLHPSEMYWRQLRFGDFDVSEMSLASLFIARAQGDLRWSALPVFTMRRFFHTKILVRTAAGIERPEQLIGKRVGVPEYQQTAAVWCRGVLQHEFGVNPRDVHWFMERNADKSHGAATGFAPPPGVRIDQIASDSSIGDMLEKGELDATLLYLNTGNLVDRSSAQLSPNAVRSLFADPDAESHRYYAKTGLLPINHTVVVRTALLEQHPWLALNLYTAFCEARQHARQTSRAVNEMHFVTGVLARDTQRLLSRDLAPYGVRAARRELETISTLLHEQGLTPNALELDQVFWHSTLDL